MLVIGGPLTVFGAAVGTVVASAAFEGPRDLEHAPNMMQVFARPIVRLTQIAPAAVTILFLILRPAGIKGGHEARWPGSRR